MFDYSIVTVDWDFAMIKRYFSNWFSNNKRDALRSIMEIKVLEWLNIKDIEWIVVCPTKHGYHFYIKFNRNLSFEELIKWRRYFYDDERRIQLDIDRVESIGDLRGVNNNVLFNKKTSIKNNRVIHDGSEGKCIRFVKD